MMGFCERSTETHYMKNKPNSDGKNSFSIINVKYRYEIYFYPDRHIASGGFEGAEVGQNECRA